MVNPFRAMHLGVICVLFVVSSVTAQTTELPSCPATAADCEGECATTCANEDCSLISAESCETTGLIDICNRDLIGAVGATAASYGLDDGACCVRRRGTRGRRLCNPNLAVANVLNKLDIDGDGLQDDSPDTDGDGLPDNWEEGGFEAESNLTGLVVDRVVFFPAPTAVVPGTPPTPIFTRRAVATSAFDADTDGDGLTDFIEVFGLKYIDDTGDGILDDGFEWEDKNGDGLPSPGEFPLNNSGLTIGGQSFAHDFDGFVFTDPTNRDTDGDGASDGDERDPLINPRAFGDTSAFTVRFGILGNDDIDGDGLGNGMDMGMDFRADENVTGVDFQSIDNPRDLRTLLDLFRRDLLDEERIPESQIEDLLGADWDGNGLWVTTDVFKWHIVIESSDGGRDDDTVIPPAEFFELNPGQLGGPKFYATQSIADISTAFSDPDYDSYSGGTARKPFIAGINDRNPTGIGLGWQELLRPTGTTQFIPDPRVWAILYSWRVPGFDIDGDGFIGVPNQSAASGISEAVAEASGDVIERNDVDCGEDGLRNISIEQITASPGVSVALVCENAGVPLDDYINIGLNVAEQDAPVLDGIIEFQCGAAATGMLLTLLGFAGMRVSRRRSNR